jgi:hypothetical protein
VVDVTEPNVRLVGADGTDADLKDITLAAQAVATAKLAYIVKEPDEVSVSLKVPLCIVAAGELVLSRVSPLVAVMVDAPTVLTSMSTWSLVWEAVNVADACVLVLPPKFDPVESRDILAVPFNETTPIV